MTKLARYHLRLVHERAEEQVADSDASADAHGQRASALELRIARTAPATFDDLRVLATTLRNLLVNGLPTDRRDLALVDGLLHGLDRLAPSARPQAGAAAH